MSIQRWKNSLAVLGITVATAVPLATWASKTEIYSAIEGTAVFSRPAPENKATAPKKIMVFKRPQKIAHKIAKTLPTKIKKQPREVEAKVQLVRVAPPSNSSGFDSVPENHKESILKRLEITAQLVRKYGRAYDYRSMTTRELEMALVRLEEENPVVIVVPAAKADPAPALVAENDDSVPPPPEELEAPQLLAPKFMLVPAPVEAAEDSEESLSES